LPTPIVVARARKIVDQNLIEQTLAGFFVVAQPDQPVAQCEGAGTIGVGSVNEAIPDKLRIERKAEESASPVVATSSVIHAAL